MAPSLFRNWMALVFTPIRRKSMQGEMFIPKSSGWFFFFTFDLFPPLLVQSPRYIDCLDIVHPIHHCLSLHPPILCQKKTQENVSFGCQNPAFADNKQLLQGTHALQDPGFSRVCGCSWSERKVGSASGPVLWTPNLDHLKKTCSKFSSSDLSSFADFHGYPWKLKQQIQKFMTYYMVVSWNRGTPKSSILMGLSIKNQPSWGTQIYGNPHIKNLLPSFTSRFTKSSVLRPVTCPQPPTLSRCVSLLVEVIEDFLPRRAADGQQLQQQQHQHQQQILGYWLFQLYLI